MKTQRGGALLLCSILLVSSALLAWSVISTWRGASGSSQARQTAANSSANEQLPPPLNSKGAKASLFYPVLKARGPQPGSNVPSKPLSAAPAARAAKID
jgi:hypothetical protein